MANADQDVQQIYFIEKLEGLFRPHRYKVLYGGRDGLKCLGLGTKVIMADGTLRAVEDVRVGEHVLGPDSKPRTVLETGRGVGPLYRVNQTSAMSYVVNDAHLISLKKSESCKRDLRMMPSGNPRSPRGRYPDVPDVVHITVREWMQKSKRWRANFRGYRAGVLEFPKQEVLIDPYFLGLWLGDGTAREMRITNPDPEIIAFCQEHAAMHGGTCTLGGKKDNIAKDIGLCVKRGRSNLLWEPFKDYGLKENKHIPHVYLSNSEEIRLSLLAGLLDTDGTMKHNGYVFTQVNKRLAYQVKFLADSLGFRTSVVEYTAICTNNGTQSQAFRIFINGDTWRIPCMVKRKQVHREAVMKRKDWRLSEVSIEPLGVGEWAGFMLDGDHLFLLEDGTVTHNSWSCARALLIMASQRPLRVLCCREIQNSLKESVHKLLSDQIDALGLSDHFDIMESEIRGKYHRSQFIYTGLEKQTKESMKSFEAIDIAWVEEAANVSKASWNILEPTIRKAGSEIWITFNPNMDTDETYIRFVVSPPPEAWVCEMNWRDNLWTSRESEMARASMLARSKEEYEHVYEGKPKTAAEGAVYQREVSDLVSQGRYTFIPYDPRLRVHTVWDMGWNDACTIHLVQTDLSAIRIIGYLEGRGVRTDEWAALLKAMPLNWGWDWIPHDGFHNSRQTGMSDYDILLKSGRRVKPKGSGIPEIGEVQGMTVLRHTFPRLYLHKGGQELIPAQYKDGKLIPGLMYYTTERLLECWKRFRYNVPKHGEPQMPVRDEFKHGCDGSRYTALAAPRMTNEDEWTGRQTMPRGIGFGVSADTGMGALG